MGPLEGLPPLVDADCRLVILGSFPGVASLVAQQYYGHPRNHFWSILRAILPASQSVTLASSYEKRSEWLLAQGIGVWDVYATCERAGSLDSAIRHAQSNDFSELLRRCPQLQAIAHNGFESYKQRRHTEGLVKLDGQGLAVYKLPSSSPANASWSFERKLAAWRTVVQQHVSTAST